jgi:hypothetical protein
MQHPTPLSLVTGAARAQHDQILDELRRVGPNENQTSSARDIFAPFFLEQNIFSSCFLEAHPKQPCLADL